MWELPFFGCSPGSGTHITISVVLRFPPVAESSVWSSYPLHDNGSGSAFFCNCLQPKYLREVHQRHRHRVVKRNLCPDAGSGVVAGKVKHSQAGVRRFIFCAFRYILQSGYEISCEVPINGKKLVTRASKGMKWKVLAARCWQQQQNRYSIRLQLH